MQNREQRIQEYQGGEVKVFINSRDDYIFINPDDTTIFDRFAEFISWIETQGDKLDKREKEITEEHGEAISYDTDGEIEQFNAEAVTKLCRIKTETYREACDKIDSIFGKDTCHKYFWRSYEINGEFVPDIVCISEFLENITPVMNNTFSERRERINLKFSKKRKGGEKNKYRTKDELIADYKGK